MKHLANSISDHLLVYVTLSFMGGIASAPYVYWPTQDIRLIRYILLFFILFSLLLHLLHFKKLLLCLLLPLSMSLGCHHAALQLVAPSEKDHIFQRIEQKVEVVIVGTMTTMAAYDGRTSLITLQAENIRYRQNPELLPARGKVLLRLQGPWPEELVPGDLLAVRTDLKRPQSFRTPGCFDYANYLAQKDIFVTGFVTSAHFIHKVTTEHSFLQRLHYWPERVRAKIGEQLDKALPPEQSSVYRALLIGDRSAIDANILESFKGSGTFHILAISGLHVTLVGAMLYFVFSALLRRSEFLLLRFTVKKWALFCTLPILVGYGLLAGMNAPVFRAVVMSCIVILAICINRPKSPGPLLAAAALFILVLEPLQLFTVSFQLSFAAVTGILFLLPTIIKLLHVESSPSPEISLPKKTFYRLLALLLVSLVANLATVPIALTYFNRFSTVGPLANLVIEPVICFWSLTTGFLALPLVFISPELSTLLFQIGGFGLQLAMQAATFFSSFSFSTLWLPDPPTWLLLLYYTSLLLFISYGWRNQYYRVITASLFSLSIFLLFSPPRQYLHSEEEDTFQLSYLDVGQGTATFLHYPNGFNLLIDGGGSSFSTTTVGKRVIAPYLWHKGIDKIDAIAITHPDADHYNGLGFIVEHFTPETLWIRDAGNHGENFKELLTLAKTNDVSIATARLEMLWQDKENSFECIENTRVFLEKDIPQTTRERENSGLILKACSKSFCALFPGDIGKEIEAILIRQKYRLKADVLLAPHHGSITSNSREFLQAVAADCLLVSAGSSSKGHFPHPGLQKDCDEQQITMLNTARHGSLQIEVQKDGYRIYGYERVETNNPLSPYEPILLYQKEIKPR